MLFKYLCTIWQFQNLRFFLKCFTSSLTKKSIYFCPREFNNARSHRGILFLKSQYMNRDSDDVWKYNDSLSRVMSSGSDMLLLIRTLLERSRESSMYVTRREKKNLLVLFYDRYREECRTVKTEIYREF